MNHTGGYSMPKEIERKFLVSNNTYKMSLSGMLYKQGYLSTDIERTVRVRICGNKAFLTIKGTIVGATRAEYEYEIPVKDAEEMLDKLCHRPIIEKHRYRYEYKGFVWEIDEFFGENRGLILAEVELEGEDQVFEKPEWIGKEVTDDFRYCNSSLVENPYKNWGK